MLQQGEVVNNRYRIAKTIVKGESGAVYRAWDTNLNLPVALKENLETSIPAQAQFEQDAIFLSRLSHPNLPRVMDYFFVSGRGQYLVMEFVEGEDLQTRLKKAGGPLPLEEVLPWVMQVCDALIYMHDQSPPVIHRDIKPANIRITPEGKAMLVDFGIAKAFGNAASSAVSAGYTPYEQYGYGITDARGDVYALAATVYALLTGEEPCDSLARKSGSGKLSEPRVLNPALPAEIESTLLHAMAIEPDERLKSVAEFRKRIRNQPEMVQPTPEMVTTPHVAPPRIATQPAAPGGEPLPPMQDKPKRTGCVIAAGAAGVFLLLAVVVGIIFLPQSNLFRRSGSPSPTVIAAVTTTAPYPTPSLASEVTTPAALPPFTMTLIPAAKGTPDPASDFVYLSNLVEKPGPEPMTPGYYVEYARGRKGQDIILSLGWCATTREILDDNWVKMAYRLVIDDRQVDLNTRAFLTAWDGSLGPCYGREMLVRNWSSGVHSIVWTHTILETLNDGKDTYAAGDYIMETKLTIP